MVAFSPKALRLINGAITEFASHGRDRWVNWTRRHPQISRRAGARWDDEDGAAWPWDIVELSLLALHRYAEVLRNRLERERLSEDETSSMDIQLSYVGSVVLLLRRTTTKPTRERRAAG